MSEGVEFEATFGHSVEPVSFDKRLQLDYTPIKEGEKWGAAWESAWFSLKGNVQAEWAGKTVVAQLNFNGEGLVFSDDGLPLQGITDGSVFDKGYGRDIYPPLLEQRAYASAVTAVAIDHAHIDTAWLWPVRETIRKCARTFASQLDLIEKYPGYIFGASQPAHYAMVKKHYPALYEKVKQAVKEGSWELQGGMWVEADCNLTGGESLVRQFIHGKNFFMAQSSHGMVEHWNGGMLGRNDL